MSTERIISEEGETNPELEAPQENNVEPELQAQNIIDYQNVQEFNQPSKCNKNCFCTCCHSFLAILIMLSIIIVSIIEFLARYELMKRYECRGLYSLVDFFVDISILILIVLLIIYIKLKKENILNAFTFYQLFTLFWSVPSLLASKFYSQDRCKYRSPDQELKTGKLSLIIISFIINFAFYKCKKCKQE